MSNVTSSRLERAHSAYCDLLQDLLCNPKNENLPNEEIEPQITAAKEAYLSALVSNEEECAAFLTSTFHYNDLEFLMPIFLHFRSARIQKAIEENCRKAFSGEFLQESEELLLQRRELLTQIKKELEK